MGNDMKDIYEQIKGMRNIGNNEFDIVTWESHCSDSAAQQCDR